jgi:hypothetical protein
VPVLILHCGTNAHLGSDRNVYNNDYGKEFELFCKTCNDAMKGQLGTRDKKLVSEANRWCFVTGMGTVADP